MAFDTQLADRVRKYLSKLPDLQTEEKKMFGGLAFVVDDKMCINVSGENLMCRFDPQIHEEIMAKQSIAPLIMKGREYRGYCYVAPKGFETNKDFEYWMDLCLVFNKKAKSSKK